jgi:hypothetical protein
VNSGRYPEGQFIRDLIPAVGTFDVVNLVKIFQAGGRNRPINGIIALRDSMSPLPLLLEVLRFLRMLNTFPLPRIFWRLQWVGVSREVSTSTCDGYPRFTRSLIWISIGWPGRLKILRDFGSIDQ